MGSGGVKLSHTEAQDIATILRDLTRPRTDDEARKIMHYVKRLEGPRS